MIDNRMRRRSRRRFADRTLGCGSERLEARIVLDSTVVFNELMYHSAGSDAAAGETEWIELHNQMSVDIDMSEWSLADGVQFDFPPETIIPGGGYLVVASDPAALIAQAGLTEHQVVGPFAGRLSNSGDSITLLNNSQRRMEVFEYRDVDPWPIGPDGGGVTLARQLQKTNGETVQHWTSSEQLGGTPGRINFDTSVPAQIHLTPLTTQSPSQFLVPDSDALGDQWKEPGYVLGSQNEVWSEVTASVGYNRDSAGPSYAEVVQADTPLTYWRFNDPLPTNDATNLGQLGANVTATYSDSSVSSGPSLLGDPSDRALILSEDAEAAAVEATAFEKLAANNGIGGTGRTTEFWISPQSTPSALASIVSDGESALDAGMMVYLTEEGRLRIYVRTTNASDFGINAFDSTRSLTLGETSHVVATWDAVTGETKLYIDGVEEPTTLVSGTDPTLGDARNTDNVLFVGLDQRNSATFDALLDEVAIYNYALSPQRVAVHHGAGQHSFDSLISNDVGERMQGHSSSAYLRIPFELPHAVDFEFLTLQTQYNDGFIVYLNGEEVVRRNAEGAARFDQAASQARTVSDTLAIEQIDLSSFTDALLSGQNLLAVQTLNVSANDGNFLFNARLDVSGTERPVAPAPELQISEVSAATDPSFQIELHNSGSEPIELGGFVIDFDGDNSLSYVFPASTLPSGGFLTLSAQEMGVSPQIEDRLFLFTPNRERFVDARRISDRLQGLSSDGSWLYPAQATFGSVNQFEFNNDVVINELMYHARPQYASDDILYAASDEEWIELYNRGSQPVDLSGWRFSDAVDFEFEVGTQLAPGAFAIVTSDAAAMAQQHPEIADRILGQYSGSLSNEGERIALMDAADNPADIVRYFDGGYWPSAADGGGSSLELRDPDADNNHASSWAASRESDQSRWQTYSYRGVAERLSGANFPTTYREFSFGLLGAGEILIDDIRVIEDPDGAAANFIQNSQFDTSDETWRLVGNHNGSVIRDPDDASNQVLHLVATGPEEHLQNHVETTLKYEDRYETIRFGTEYEIQFRAKWLSGSPQLNTRLFFNTLPRTTILDMPGTSGTPGRANSTQVDNLGPSIDQLRHTPTYPSSTESIVVRAQAHDPDNVVAAQLWYSVDDAPAESIPMTVDETGELVGVIPRQRAGVVVQFYVTATDGSGMSAQYPPQGPRSSALFRVDDPLESETGLQTLDVIVTQQTEAELGRSTNLMSNERLGSTVVVNGVPYYDVGVRLKGSEHGRADRNRRGFGLRFRPEELFRGEHSSVGVDRSGGWRFGRTFGQDEILVHQFINRAGNVPGMYNDLAYISGPTLSSSTAMLQLARFSNDYLDEQFQNGSDGTLFEYELIYTMLTNGGVEGEKVAQEGPSVFGIPVGRDFGENAEFYRHYFLIKNNRDRDDYSGMIRLAQTLALPRSSFLAEVENVIDVDQWLRAFAALSLSGANDNYNVNSQHNALFYDRPEDGKMMLFPYDMDFAFHTSATAPMSSNSTLTQLLRVPQYEHHFLGHLHDIMETSFNADYLTSWADHYDQLLGGQGLPSIVSWVRSRERYLQRQLPESVEFNVGPDAVEVNEPFAVIEGEGWINVRDILLGEGGDGVPLDVTWTTPTHWQASVPVEVGTNQVTLTAVDFRGNVLASDQLNVTSTVANELPGRLVISEVNYHPADPTAEELTALPGVDAEDFEFVEVFNRSDSSLELQAASFRDGVEFVFPQFELAAGARAVIVSNLAAFQLRYGSDRTVIGQFSQGRLANSGERLQLVDARGNSVFQLEYNDALPWPELADGLGRSIELIAPMEVDFAADVDASAWRSSIETDGSPGLRGAGEFDTPIDSAFVDQVCRERGSDDARYDFDGNGTVDPSDIEQLLQLKGAPLGDANLDGVFDSRDLVQVFQRGEYEDALTANSFWSSGDWNCDGDFGTPDLVAAFQQGAYTAGAIARPLDMLLARNEQDRRTTRNGARFGTKTSDNARTEDTKTDGTNLAGQVPIDTKMDDSQERGVEMSCIAATDFLFNQDHSRDFSSREWAAALAALDGADLTKELKQNLRAFKRRANPGV